MEQSKSRLLNNTSKISDNMIYFSNNLKYLRKKYKYQQEALADILNVKANTISNYERGISQPDYSILNILINYFGVTAQQLLYEDLSKYEDTATSPNEKSRFLTNCEICNEKDKRINELHERINEQSEIIHYFIKKNG